MADAAPPAGSVETRAESFPSTGEGDASYWKMQLSIAEKEEKNWHKQADRIVKRYRADTDNGSGTTGRIQRFNILWSNVQTLMPWLFGGHPKPEVERRFKDADPVGLMASRVLERSLSYEDDADDANDTIGAVVQDRLLCGRGQAWLRYVPHFGAPVQPPPPTGTDEQTADQTEEEDAEDTDPVEPARQLDWEEAPVDYVFWKDFRHSPARRWKEVSWVARRSYMTRSALKARFKRPVTGTGKTVGDMVPLDYSPKGTEDNKLGGNPDAFKKATVWEIWDKDRREAVWVSPDYEECLDRKPDPLGLKDFFPCPPPLFATTTNDKLVPVPDYVEYQDQAEELDRLTVRLGKLMNALQAKGIYPASNKNEIAQLLDPNSELAMIAVTDWQAFVDKGGIEKMIGWLPIQQIAAVMIQLFEARDRVKQVIYETTGLADILRASTDPRETLGAQQLKSNFASMRLTESQKQVARFARDVIRLRAEIMARHFTPKTFALMSNLPEQMPAQPQPPQPLGGNAAMDPAQAQQFQAATQKYAQDMAAWTAEAQKRQAEFEAAVKLLHDDAGRGFRVDIETDSTVSRDDQQDKAAAIEFVTTMTEFLSQAVQGVRQVPALGKLSSEITMYLVRHFKVGRSLEAKFQEAVDEAMKAAAQTPPPQQQQHRSQPDPNVGQGAVMKGQAALTDAESKAREREQLVGLKAQEIQDNAAYDAADIGIKERAQQTREQAQAVREASLQRAEVRGMQ